jgi:glycerophosphoryl diester phosphodiesterase
MAAGGASWVAAAHRLGRLVHAWTFRDDQPQADASPVDECAGAFALGCDGLFCDFPATGLVARAAASPRLRRVTHASVETLREGPV